MKKRETEAHGRKRKLVEDYLAELKEKWNTVQDMSACLNRDVDKLAEEAKGKAGSQMAQLISKSNALGRACKNKPTELKMIEEEIAAKREELRHI